MDRTQSLALLLADGLRFSARVDDHKLDDAIYALELISRGNVTDQEEEDFHKRMLDNGWAVTAPFPSGAYP